MPTRWQIIRKTIEGISEAQDDYESLSGGSWLWEAPEYFTTVYITRSISRLEGEFYLTLESLVWQTIDDAGGVGRGRIPAAMRLGGNFDIVYWGRENPVAVIEVKKQIRDFSQIRDDLSRIIAILNRENTTFRYGIIAYFISTRDTAGETAEERLLNRIHSIENGAMQFALRRALRRIQGCYPATYNLQLDGDSAWTARAILVQ